jgi:hypothetical protein
MSEHKTSVELQFDSYMDDDGNVVAYVDVNNYANDSDPVNLGRPLEIVEKALATLRFNTNDPDDLTFTADCYDMVTTWRDSLQEALFYVQRAIDQTDELNQKVELYDE